MSSIITKNDSVAGPLETLTGNSGGPVGPDVADNINIIGANGVLVTGNAGLNTLTITSSFTAGITSIDNIDSPYTVLTTDQCILADSSTGAITIRLPNAPTTGQYFIIKDSGGTASTANITLTTVGGVVTIDGATSIAINTDYQSVTVIFNGSAYFII